MSHPRVIPHTSHVRRRKTRGVVSLRFALAAHALSRKFAGASRGARGRVSSPPRRLSWEELETLTTSRGLVRYCAEPTAPDAVGADAAVSAEREGVCLVLGSEGQGLSETALRTCRPVAIPMPGEMESLNVGIAGGILMYLMRKER